MEQRPLGFGLWGFWGLGFRVWGILRFGFWGFGVLGGGFEVSGLGLSLFQGFRVEGCFRLQGLGYRVLMSRETGLR